VYEGVYDLEGLEVGDHRTVRMGCCGGLKEGGFGDGGLG